MSLQKHLELLRHRLPAQLARPAMQQLRGWIDDFIFIAKPNCRILSHGSVTPCWLLKSNSTIEFQQVTPPSLTHVRTQVSVIALGKQRILIATHAPLSAEYGAAQIALNLGGALRALGHDVVLWTPHPLEAHGRWLKKLNSMRQKLDDFVSTQPRFDVVDAPASLITERVQREALVVVRSVQPDLRYLAIGFLEGLRLSPVSVLRLLDRILQSTYHGYLVLQGWIRADLIVCMGQLELQWMKRRFPFWGRKLRSYVAALSDADQERLRIVRSRRAPIDPKRDVRFLWIGRWTRHKGSSELLEFAEKWIAVRPQDRITIAGCGTAAVSAIPRRLLDTGRIEIVSAYARSDLPALLAAHDIGLFTSKVEGWGLALNEMLESGMPVYATQAGGERDLAIHLHGQLHAFPPEPSDLERDAAGTQNWTKYYEMFSWGAIARRYVEAVERPR